MKRSEILQKFLEDVKAHALNECDLGNSTLTIYAINGRIVIVQMFKNDHGFELFIPATDRNDYQSGFDAVKKATGLLYDSHKSITIQGEQVKAFRDSLEKDYLKK